MNPYPPFPFEFQIGQFVLCSYDFTITWWISEEEATNVFYGVIVARSEKDIYFPYGAFYQVFCTDGEMRFFAEWEMKHIIHDE